MGQAGRDDHSNASLATFIIAFSTKRDRVGELGRYPPRTEDGEARYATRTTAPRKISGKIRSTSRVRYCTGRGEDTKRCKNEEGLETEPRK